MKTETKSPIQALTGHAGGEMKRAHDLALDLGAKTKHSALEAAQGMEELLKADMSTSQVIGDGLEGSLNLAAPVTEQIAQAAKELHDELLQKFSAEMADELLVAAMPSLHSSLAQPLFIGESLVDCNASETIPSFAQGAVVTNPVLALVGNGEPEAFLPLSQTSFRNKAIRPIKMGAIMFYDSNNKLMGSVGTEAGCTEELVYRIVHEAMNSMFSPKEVKRIAYYKVETHYLVPRVSN